MNSEIIDLRQKPNERIYLPIHKLCEDYGAFSSTYYSAITFDSFPINKYVLPYIENDPVELLPKYYLKDVFKHPDTKLRLYKYRRKDNHYRIKIWVPGFTNYSFIFEGYSKFDSVAVYVLRDILRPINYKDRRHVSVHDATPASDISMLLTKYTRKELKNALDDLSPPMNVPAPVTLDSFSELELLQEVERRYKKTIGPDWPKLFLPKEENNKVNLKRA